MTSSAGWVAAARAGAVDSEYLHNEGNFIISLGGLVQWLGTQAESLGVDVFAGFAAALPLFDDDGSVAGVQIGDMGVQHDGSRGPNYTPGPGSARAPHRHCRRLPRQPRQGAHQALQARRATRIRRCTRSA